MSKVTWIEASKSLCEKLIIAGYSKEKAEEMCRVLHVGGAWYVPVIVRNHAAEMLKEMDKQYA